MYQTSEVRGGIPTIVRNANNLYQGNLVGYFRSVFNYAENLENPYHNFRHLCHVLWLCHEACVFYKNKMSKREMRTLLIAALFHDFDHTGAKGPDATNIELAVAGLKNHIEPEDRDELPSICGLIRATEYPYKVPTESLGLRAQILRDADMGQAFSVAWIQQVIFGLSAEWGMSPLALLKTEVEFHRKIKFHTEWARALFPPAVIEAKIAEINDLNSLLSDS